MSSACYVYAIVGRHTPLPDPRDRGAAGLSMVPCRELAAVTRRLEQDGAPLTADAVLHHEAVVEAVRRQGPALPVRFGTVFRDTTSVASALEERYEPLAADLDRLGDKVEVSLTALWAEPATDDAMDREEEESAAFAGRGEGARYLRARAAEVRRDDALKDRARTVARELDEVMGALAIERRTSILPTPRIAVRAAYLLDPARVADFRTAVEAARGARGEVRVLLTGPWPPYSFVTRTETGVGAPSGDRFAALAQLLTDVRGGRLG